MFGKKSESASPSLTTQATASSTSGVAYVPDNLLLGTDSTSTLGSFLIGFNGMTLYMFTQDATNSSNCRATCTTMWPPYTVSSTIYLSNLQAGVNGTVGTITRDDDSVQVTYDQHPLYFYSKDVQSGDTNGQNVGGVWFIVDPSASASSTASITPPTSGAKLGEHCGGNMTTAKICAAGLHCAPTPGSHLPFGDVGGTCVAGK